MQNLRPLEVFVFGYSKIINNMNIVEQSTLGFVTLGLAANLDIGTAIQPR